MYNVLLLCKVQCECFSKIWHVIRWSDWSTNFIEQSVLYIALKIVCINKKICSSHSVWPSEQRKLKISCAILWTETR
jgi:hypothetical protein